MNEAEFKSHFKKAVKTFRGYSISLSAPALPGIPDLYVILPGFMPVLLEAKWLGVITLPKFKRKIQYTPMQMHFLDELNLVHPCSAFGLIGMKYQDVIYTILKARQYREQSETIDSNTFMNIPHKYAHTIKELQNIDVISLFEQASIPRINGYVRPKVENQGPNTEVQNPPP